MHPLHWPEVTQPELDQWLRDRPHRRQGWAGDTVLVLEEPSGAILAFLLPDGRRFRRPEA